MKKRLCALLCAVLLVCCWCLPAAAEQIPRTVRVGMTDLDNFFYLDEKGQARGYGGDYLTELSRYTGWNYEYVTGTWSECLQRLRDGEIDLLFPAQYSAERGEEFLFSDVQCCIDYVTLLARADNSKFYFNDYEAFDGITVGMVDGNYLNDMFADYAREHNFTYTPLYYSSYSALNAALAAGRVDAVINGNLNAAANQKLLAKFGFVPAYFITTPDNADLMAELDQALYQLTLDSPNFFTKLNEAYYGDTTRQAQSFSREEAEYVENSPALTVLCDPDNYPFEWADETGVLRGVNIDLMNLLAQKSGLSFQYVARSSSENAIETVQSGKADILTGLYPSDFSGAGNALQLTDSYISLDQVLVAKRYSVFTPSRHLTVILRESETGMQDYLAACYPQWTILTAKSVADCLQAVDTGQADAAFVAALSLQTVPLLENYPDLSILSTMSEDVALALGISKDADPLLFSVLNKTILQLSSGQIEQAITQNSLAISGEFSLRSAIRQHPSSFAGLLTLAALLLWLFAWVFYRSHVKTVQTRLLTEKNDQMQDAIALARHADRAREQYDQLYNTAICGIVQISLQAEPFSCRLLNANREATRLTGLSSDALGEDNLALLRGMISELDLASLWSMIAATQQTGDKCPIDLHLTLPGTDGIWVSGTLELIALHGEEKVMQATFMDTTRRKEEEEKLRLLSEIDPLTGLFNKATAEQLFAQALDSNPNVYAFFVIDLDNFKDINDTFGHPVGDTLLNKVGHCLAGQFRADDIVGRIGGDEFAALLCCSGAQPSIDRLAKRICNAIESIELKTPGFSRISCSMGIALVQPKCGYHPLFACADRALYEAKKTGKSGWAICQSSETARLPQPQHI